MVKIDIRNSNCTKGIIIVIMFNLIYYIMYVGDQHSYY